MYCGHVHVLTTDGSAEVDWSSAVNQLRYLTVEGYGVGTIVSVPLLDLTFGVRGAGGQHGQLHSAYCEAR